MINIITKFPDKGVKIISDINVFFNNKVFPKYFDNLESDVMKNIDDAELLDKNTGAVKTRFGVTDIYHLSSGCKTVLVYIAIFARNCSDFKDYVIDITECGENALEELFKCVDYFGDSKTLFLLRHVDNLYHCSSRQYNVNNKVFTNLSDGAWYSE